MIIQVEKAGASGERRLIKRVVMRPRAAKSAGKLDKLRESRILMLGSSDADSERIQ